ncbi:DUF2066 domain-containing protein [Halioglobus maricola]|uniref:DUF2066 domain-containing protein n=1 Tax=Halioglobus maricola TaxID=2601894 RepID=A0A5P9NGG5_9GAMM|nr:DUF2066 domain-containing protein [Halioglobus maricola]QFU74871.1 DUF2066 domain-containing protein [Halioglobus maricola]
MPGTIFRLLAVMAVGLLLAGTVSADVVQNLYSARVPVVDQSSQTIAAAASDALGQVVVKVSGSEEALEHPTVRKAMGNARSQVQQYAFQDGDTGLVARFQFETSYVQRLVKQAGLPLWTANRPRVIAWLVTEQGGERQFVNMDTTPELARELMDEFDARGVPAQLPLYDLTDATAVSTDDVWALNGDALQAASQRYDVDDVLFGRVVAMSTGEWLGDWSYLYGRHRLDRHASAPESLGFSRQGVALAAESMAQRYAVVTSGADDARVVMNVTGINEFGAYAELVNWLEGLELVDHANVRRIAGDRVELTLVSMADADDLAKLIELNEHLVPQAVVPGQLDYLWQK